ncbi:MAG: hypothetical protein IJG13_07050, partial [Kiritimatiellae bacterium]|nr:hypothetical protein [Kiritimatiellia bacterium]
MREFVRKNWIFWVQATVLTVALKGCMASAADLTNTVVMIDQRGNINPSNAVATVTEAAATATRLAAAEVAAAAYSNAEAKTSAAVDDLAAAIIGQNLVVYEDDFMYSLGDAIAITTNCQCR